MPGFRVECSTVPAPLVYPLMRFERIRRELGYAPAFDLDSAVADCLVAR